MTRRKQKNKLRRLQANIFPKKIKNSPLHFVGKTSSTRSPPPVIIQGDSFVATSRSRLGCPERHFRGDQRLQCGRQQRWGKDMMSLSFMPNLHSGIPDNLKWIQFSYGIFHLAIWYGNSSYKNPSLFCLLEWTATWRKLQSLRFWNLNSPPKKKKQVHLHGNTKISQLPTCNSLRFLQIPWSHFWLMDEETSPHSRASTKIH